MRAPPGGFLILLSLIIGACAAALEPGVVPDSQMSLDVSNETSIPIALVVNHLALGNVVAGRARHYSAAELPSLPWHAEARTLAGRTVVELDVRSGAVRIASNGSRGVAMRVDLSCGRIDLWSGPPLAGPAPGPGTPGDCD
jgi:hypothetical protein